MDQAEALEIARRRLYPKGLPHPGCDATAAVFEPETGSYHFLFPTIWWVNRNTLRKLARRRAPIPPAPGVMDPSHALVIVQRETGRVRVL